MSPANKQNQAASVPATTTSRPAHESPKKLLDLTSLVGKTVSVQLNDRTETCYSGMILNSVSSLGVVVSGSMRGSEHVDFIPLNSILWVNSKSPITTTTEAALPAGLPAAVS